VVDADLVVPVGDHEDGGQVADPAPDVSQHVQGRLVGPVRILDGQHGRRAGQHVKYRREHALPIVGHQRLGERVRVAAADVAQRAERARGQQIVAGADEQPGLSVGRAQERAQHTGLADARLSADEDHAASARPASVSASASTCSSAARSARTVGTGRWSQTWPAESYA
jgi:hypothetical protein